MKKYKQWLAFGILTCFLSGCSANATSSTSANACVIVGSTSVEAVAEELKHGFEAKEDSPFRVEIQAVGSSAGITALHDKTCDIAMVSRNLTTAEESSGLVAVPIALDGIAIIVHKDNPVSNLSTEQLHNIFSGKITNWSEVGGDDGEIIVISRESGSGTRDAFESMLDLRAENGFSHVEDSKPLIADGNGAVKSNVVSKPRAIGYISIDILDNAVKGISVDGVEPTEENIVKDIYPLYRPFLFVLPESPSEDASLFIEYTLSEEGQEQVRLSGFIPYSQVSSASKGV